MSVYEGCAFALLGAVLFFVLKEARSALSPLLPVLGGIALFLSAFLKLAESEVFEFFGKYGLGDTTVKTVFKVLFVGFLTEISSDICEELGAGTLSRRLCFFGNVEIFLITWPILSEILESSMEMLS